ncbi:O-antigen ligase family protein [Parasphingorhabdus sp. JC815]|uniref:O-antigen ligase family protein n=1 Tax=Parasphingorhabdus sp. JC815 TaxID=3232140 RepID=UPI00345B47D3
MSEYKSDNDLSVSRGLAVFGLMALTPILAVFLPWDFGPIESDYRKLIAGNSLAVILVELFVFIVLLKNENLISDFVKKLDLNDKIVGSVFILASTYSLFYVSSVKSLFILGFLAILIHVLFTISLFKNAKYVAERTQNYFWIILGVSVVVYTALWAIDFLIFPPTTEDWIDRVPGVTNIRWAGFFWLSVFAAGFALIKTPGAKSFALALFFGAFGLTMTLWTGTRGSLVAIIFGAICSIIFAPTYRKSIVKYCIASAAVAILINIYASVPHVQYGIDRIISRGQPAEMIERGGSGRTTLWKHTAEISLNHPVVGHGIDQFQKMGPKETLGFKGPHSFLLQLLFSVGVVGILSILYGTSRFLQSYRLEVHRPHQLAAFVFFSGGCLYAVYDNFGYYPYPIAIFTLSVFMLFKPRDEAGRLSA